MKKTLLFFVFTAFVFIGFSQETEGYLQYSIKVEAADTTLEAKQKAGMLRNSKMEIYFSQKFSRVDFAMGQMYQLTAVVNLETDRTISLMSGAMGKLAMRTITSEADAAAPVMPETSVKLSDETKIILEYNCKKAILTTDGVESTYWYTNEIDIDITGQQVINPLIPGFPLEFSSITEGVKMSFTASNLKFELENKDEIFYTEVPVGYTMMQDVDAIKE